MSEISIETHGGISGETNFEIFVKDGIAFYIDNQAYISQEYNGAENRQCYKCAFCHGIDLCSHFQCQRDGKLFKFRRLNIGKKDEQGKED